MYHFDIEEMVTIAWYVKWGNKQQGSTVDKRLPMISVHAGICQLVVNVIDHDTKSNF